jgi:hypothetical protein
MSSVSVEDFDPAVHCNRMPEVALPATPRKVLVVTCGRFRLEFLSRAQLEAAIAYFRSPSGSTRMHVDGGDHWEYQPWQSRLPAGINNRHNRAKVLSALESASAIAQAELP